MTWIAACENEPIHIPGAIQAWGALLIADAGSLEVVHASANLAEFLGVSSAAALGMPLCRLLGEMLLGALLARLDAAATAVLSPAHGFPPGRALTVTGHRLGGAVYVEIEPARAAADPAAPAGDWPQAPDLVAALRCAATEAALFAVAAAQMRRITGANRAMVYRFDEVGHGEVIAEDLAAGLEPFLGLHYPASDVPRQARALYLRQLVRVIGDATAPPVALLAAAPGRAAPDLSLCALRAIAPVHLQYLNNMGVRATVAVSLIVAGALWGMLICHADTPSHVAAETRGLCAVIGDVVALKVATLREQAVRAAAAERRSRLKRISARLVARRGGPAALAAALAEEGPELAVLCAARGVIVRLGGRSAGFGEAPDGAAAGALLDALLAAAPAGAELFASDSLGLSPAQGDIAGALLLPLNHIEGDAIAWLRPEQAQAVRWAGDPTVAVRDAGPDGLLPRRSFTVWLDEVRGRSLPWGEEEQRAALGLRREIDKLLAAFGAEMRLARDAADRASRAKSEFLATMSHEIRSPMSGLLGVLELLRATELDPEQSRMAGMVHNSAAMLLAVLNDILDFSKIEAGALSVTPEPTALRALLDDLVQPHAVAGNHRGVIVRLSIDPDLPDGILTDPLRLRQILGNLLSNALKFTAAGTVTMTVGQAADRPAPTLRFSVRDTGIGMSEAVLARLFMPFAQADGSTTRNFGGTGLGLSISRKLARLLEGDITVTSEVGQGSEFCLALPLRPCVLADAAVAAPEALSAAPWRDSGCRVLVVDDDPTIRWLSQRQLERLGLLVDHADDGAAGLEALRTKVYDLVLTDCHMPRMDGVALTRAVRESAVPGLQRVPIIGLTADVTEAQRALCSAAGMSDLAIKPLTIQALSRLLHRHLPVAGADAADADGDAPALREVPFDDQIYRAVFAPGDADGAAWLRDYLEAAAADHAALAALDAADLAETARLAHHLAGASFSVGAMLLGAAARALERAALAGDVAALPGLHAALHEARDAAEAAIRGFLVGEVVE